MSSIKELSMEELMQRRSELKAALFGITYSSQKTISPMFKGLNERLMEIDAEIQARRIK